MELSVREITASDVELIVDYFVHADVDFLSGMGADKGKLPERSDWINMLIKELDKPTEDKKLYYILWQLDGQPVGHSNINYINYGNSANMHLHLWNSENRQSGIGTHFLRKTIPFYFDRFRLKTLVCEPYALNPAPNSTLKKLGFRFVRAYETTPGIINFHQKVNRYELTRQEFDNMNGK